MTITYADGGSNLLVSTNIVPSNTIIANKTFTLTGTNTTVGLNMSYKVGLKYNSSFSDGMIHYYIKKTNSSNSNITANFNGTTNQTIPGHPSETGYATGTLSKGNKYLELVTGEFPSNITNQTITFNLKLQFPDTNTNQDSEKGKTINAEVVVNHEQTFGEYIASLDMTENSLEIDDTTDKNIRYVGASPKNYLTYNDETWRIIGLFNNIISIDENGKETTESLVKIIRNDSFGINYAWDTSDSTINRGWGVNEWSQAKLMYELNCDGDTSSKYCSTDIEITDGYLSNKTSGETTWYNESKNTRSATYDYSSNIKSSSIDKIANVRWNLGGGSSTSSATALNMYNAERGTAHVSNPIDGITRTNTWDGKVALIYPSDYGYASTDIDCRTNIISRGNGIHACSNNNWLYNTKSQWLLTSNSFSEWYSYMISRGGVSFIYSWTSMDVRPAIFLKSDVVIAGGTGTETDPYTF